MNKECNELVNEGNRLQRELGAQTTNCQRLASENQIRGAALKAAEAALAAAKTENSKLARGLDSATAKLRLAEEKRTQQEQARDELRCRCLLVLPYALLIYEDHCICFLSNVDLSHPHVGSA